MSRDHAVVVGGALASGVSATIYKVPREGDFVGYTRYYFCCDVCGACGNHTLRHELALDEATWHVLNAHNQEANNG